MNEENDLISIIIVIYYNNKEEITRVINSILDSDYHHYEIILINNNVNNNREMHEYFNLNKNKIRIINSNRNLGYAAGNNLGAKHAKGEYLLFLNPDAIIPPDLLGFLIEKENELKRRYGTDKFLLSPKIDIESGEQVFCCGTVNCLGFAFMNKDRGDYNPIQKTDFVSGCCLMVKNSHFREMGMFNENYFMYHEDVELSLRARIKGYKLLILNEISVLHLKNDEEYQLTRNKYYYVERNRIITLLVYSKSFIKASIALLLFEPIFIIFSIMKGEFIFDRLKIQKYIFANLTLILSERKVITRHNLFFSDKFKDLTFFVEDKLIGDWLTLILSFIFKILSYFLKD